MYNALAITGIFQQYSIDVDLAVDGEQAIELVKERFYKYKMSYELIIMDYNLPSGDGITTT